MQMNARLPLARGRMGLRTGGAWGPGYDPAASALFARFDEAPEPERKAQINDTIVALKAAGVWAKLDAFYMLAAHDAQAARQNWIANTFNLTPVSAPTFAADRGYTSDGIAAYLDTNFNPVTAAGKFALNDSHLGAYVLTNVAEDRNDAGNVNNRIFSRTAGGSLSGRMGATTAGSPLPSGLTTSIGHSALSRANSAEYRSYRNGLPASVPVSTSASSAMTSATFFVLHTNTGIASPSTKQIAVAHFGSSITDADEAAIYAATQTHLQSIGAIA